MTTALRVLVDRLPTRVNLEKRRIVLESNLCVLCEEEEESRSHVFFKCKVAWNVWCMCSKWVGEGVCGLPWLGKFGNRGTLSSLRMIEWTILRFLLWPNSRCGNGSRVK